MRRRHPQSQGYSRPILIANHFADSHRMYISSARFRLETVVEDLHWGPLSNARCTVEGRTGISRAWVRRGASSAGRLGGGLMEE